MLRALTEFGNLFLVGIAAGALNSAGGGGTFVALPALVAAGLPPVTANATSTAALLPGALSSAWVYRDGVVPVGVVSTRTLSAMSIAGGGLGAGLLLILPGASFTAAFPWLLTFATAVLALGRPISRLLGAAPGRLLGLGPKGVLAAQFLLGVYGGFFGGAVGIMMLALWSVGLGLDAAAGNPMRVLQLAAINAPAAAVFLLTGAVLGDPLLLVTVLVGALAGGYAGAHVARRLPACLLRGVVLATAVTMTVLSFLHA